MNRNQLSRIYLLWVWLVWATQYKNINILLLLQQYFGVGLLGSPLVKDIHRITKNSLLLFGHCFALLEECRNNHTHLWLIKRRAMKLNTLARTPMPNTTAMSTNTLRERLYARFEAMSFLVCKKMSG